MSTENFNENDLTEFADLALALEEQRPEPSPEFTERLDAAVADHFPEEWSARSSEGSPAGFFASLKRWMETRRGYLLPVNAGLAGLAVIVIAVGIGLNQGGPGDQPTISENSTTIADSGAGGSSSNEGFTANSTDGAAPSSPEPEQLNWGKQESRDLSTADRDAKTLSAAPTSESADGIRPFSGTYQLNGSAIGPNAAGIENRKVAQEAEITLGTKPEDVQGVSNEIVETVDDHDGIVLDSRVIDGPAGEASAEFSLMIPSTKLESAIADLSGIADLRARQQETEDITAPTLTVGDKLETSKAKVKSLVAELEEATTDEQRAEVEAELRAERGRVSRLTTRLNKLERRANLTPVSVTVETGGDTSSSDDGSWGIGDALDDAGHMLGIAAGVALIALAIAIPIGAIVLIALALNRAWVRRARQRALDEN